MCNDTVRKRETSMKIELCSGSVVLADFLPLTVVMTSKERLFIAQILSSSDRTVSESLIA